MKNLLASLLLILTLTGCLPVSQNPLSSPENAGTDPRLVGVWYGKSGEDEIFLHFIQGAVLQVVEVDHEKKGGAHTTLYNVFVTVLGEQHYLNIREGKNKPYYLAHYQLKEGVLKISLMSDNSLAKAIKAGKLKGTVTGKPEDLDVTITDTTERLAGFVKKSETEKLFDQKFGTFKKVQLPPLSEGTKSAPKGKTKKKK